MAFTLTIDRHLSRPRVQFTPAGYKRARKLWRTGNYNHVIAMMQEASVDSHVAGCLAARRAGYKRPFILAPFDETDADKARRVWMQSVLTRLNLRDLLEAIHDARLYIFTVIDFDWEVVGGLQTPVQFQAIEHHHFRRDDSGVLRIDRGRSLEEIPDTALVVEYRKTPIMLPVLRDYILKEFGLESWSGFLEVFAEPFIIAYYPPGATPEQKKEIDDGLAALAASSRGKAPKGTELQIIESARTTGDHGAYVERSDKGISITLLGHANAVEQASGLQIGDNPTSFEVKWEIGTDDCCFVEPHINRLIQIIYDRNYADRRYPEFSLSKERPLSRDQRADIVDMAWRHGVTILPVEYMRLGLELDPDQGPIRRDPLNLFD